MTYHRRQAEYGLLYGADGGAVILCSLTTTLGYLAAVRSQNYAVRSMGAAAAIGALRYILAAVLALPAGLLRIDRAHATADAKGEQ